MITVLITAGAGFVGARLADDLLRGESRARALDSLVDQPCGQPRARARLARHAVAG